MAQKDPNDWVTVEPDDWETVEETPPIRIRNQPAKFDPLAQVKETAGKVYTAATTPVANIRSGKVKEATDAAAAQPGMQGRIARGLNFGIDTISGLSSPLNAATMFAGGGAGVAAKVGRPLLSKGLGMTEAALSAPVIAHGAQQFQQPGGVNQAVGAIEMVGGLAGIRGGIRQATRPGAISQVASPNQRIPVRQGEVIEPKGLMPPGPAHQVRPPTFTMPDGTQITVDSAGQVVVVGRGPKALPAPANPLPAASPTRPRYMGGRAVNEPIRFGEEGYDPNQPGAFTRREITPPVVRAVQAQGNRFAKGQPPPVYDGNPNSPFENNPAGPNQLHENPLKENPQQIPTREDPFGGGPIPDPNPQPAGKPIKGQVVPEPPVIEGEVVNPAGTPSARVKLDILPEHLDVSKSHDAIAAAKLKPGVSKKLRELIGDYREGMPLSDEQAAAIKPFLVRDEFAPVSPVAGIPNSTIGSKIKAGLGRIRDVAKPLYSEQSGRSSETGALNYADIYNAMAESHPIKIAKGIGDFSKSLLSSTDLSGLRQGKALWHTGDFWNSLDDMFKAAGSEKAYKQIMWEIKQRKLFRPDRTGKSIAERAGLDTPELLNSKEETMMSALANKLPNVRMSNRAYTAFLNKLRTDHFERLYNSYAALNNGVVDEKAANQIATFINNATGRGSLGKYEQDALIKNLFFAPKYTASRFHMIDPRNYISPNIDPFVRKQYWKSLAAQAGAVAASGTLYN